MNFWNNPKNKGIRAVIIIIVVAVAAFFVYKYSIGDSLAGTARVIGDKTATAASSASSSSGKGGTGGSGSDGTATNNQGSGGGDQRQCTKATVTSFTVAADNATFPASTVHFDKYGEDGGHFVVTNTTPCGITIKTLEFAMTSTFPATGWQPIGGGSIPGSPMGGLRLHEGIAVTTGAMFNTPIGPVFGSALAVPGSDALHSMTFTDPVGYTIPAYSSEKFALEVDSYNIEAPGTIHIGLYSVSGVNATTAASYTWTATAASAASVTASPITLVYP